MITAMGNVLAQKYASASRARLTGSTKRRREYSSTWAVIKTATARTLMLNAVCISFGGEEVRQVHCTSIDNAPTKSASERLRFTTPTKMHSTLTETIPRAPGSRSLSMEPKTVATAKDTRRTGSLELQWAMLQINVATPSAICPTT